MYAEQVVHPKTDQQKSRLHASIADSFIFKTLDPEQVSELVDAMFVKEVSLQLCRTSPMCDQIFKQVANGEHVIDQGDEGDNFYIIDRWVGGIVHGFVKLMCSSLPFVLQSSGFCVRYALSWLEGSLVLHKV